MELINVIKNRRSVRDYMDVAVDRETIERLIDAAIQAPSKMNAQPWAFAVVLGRERIDEYAKRAKEWLLPKFGHPSDEPSMRHALEDPAYFVFGHAPALILVMAASSEVEVTCACSLAAGNLMLAARNEGLGACWVDLARLWLNLPAIKIELKIPKRYHVIAPIILGHPKAWPESKGRKPAEIHWL
jgi:nitroreductase